jgi:cathepsin D
VEHASCGNCANQNKFKSWESDTFELASTDLSSLRYGKGYVEGFDSLDTVCLNPNSSVGFGCMEDYKFKSIKRQEDLSGLAGSGIVGLAPTDEFSGAQLFVPSLYQ